MLYIYDVLLNFNSELVDFYEWENKDQIYYIKKIPIFRVSCDLMDDIMISDVIFEKEFIDRIYLRTEYSIKKEIDDSSYLVLLSDLRTVIGLKISNEGRIVNKSVMLLEDELEVLDIVEKLSISDIKYKKIDKLNFNYLFLTRKEQKIKKFLLDEIKKLYKMNDFNKLSYFYYEYYDKKASDINLIYKDLIKSINNDIDDKHLKIFNLIKLMYEKNV